ncbi:MAG: type II toxin-antitoxin system VapC family toxin [Nitrospirae bacterium]|nr:MAG: type II toxin-antitoxin system VapC family toxin [Nitrospirota bacterium]
MDSAVVLDSFAIIAHLEGEERGAKVTALLRRAQSGKLTAYMSVINLGEVYYITARERGGEKAEETLLLLRQLPIKIINADMELTVSAAIFKAKHPIAYADCFAAALSKSKGIPLVTGHPEFKRLEDEVKIMWI